MSEAIFELPTLGSRKFICNAETGNWVLADFCDADVIDEISKPHDFKRTYENVSLTLLNVSRICNFNCKYCLIGDLKGFKSSMSLTVGKKAIDRVMELPKEDRYVIFHGSEPMANYKLIKQLVIYTTKNNSNIQFSIQSNGSLFNKENINFLTQNNVYIGISLDGTERHQNSTRPYTDGSGTYNDVIKNLLLIKERQGEIGVTLVITKENVNELPQIIEHFEGLGIGAVYLCPVAQGKDNLSPNIEILTEKMLKIFDRFFNLKLRGEKTIEIENFRKHLINIIPKNSPSNCVQCSLGSKYPLVGIDIDGGIYPCDYFWDKKEFLLGNIFDHALNSVINLPQDFRTYKNVNSIPGCSTCDWKRFCGGGCPGSEIMSGRDIRHTKSPYCHYNKTMLQYVAERIPILYEKNLIDQIITRKSIPIQGDCN